MGQHTRSARSDVLPSPSRLIAGAVRTARDAWARGDYAACLQALQQCADVPEPGELRDEALLLRARSLYRLRRFREVVTFLEPLIETFGAGDAVCTARMLHGVAVARSGDIRRGLRLLGAVADDAEVSLAHRAVRAEIAHARSLAYWTNGQLDEALRFAYAAESARADVISVRAAQLRGFIAISKQRYQQALDLFRAAFTAYQSCRERDAELVETTLVQIASLEVLLRSSTEQGTHRAPNGRRLARPWEERSPTCSVERMQILALDAWLFACDGDDITASRYARRAQVAAPTDAWRVWALSQRAALALGLRETINAHGLSSQAVELLQAVDWRSVGEERLGLLFLAETLAHIDPAAALSVLNAYDASRATSHEGLDFAKEPRVVAREDNARGLVARSQRDFVRGHQLLRSAWCGFNAVGNRWRAAQALIELDATPTPGTLVHPSCSKHLPVPPFYLEAASAIVREHFPRSFLARRLGGWMAAYHDPVVSRLSPARREVLRHMLDGVDNKTIARRMGRSYNTVRNHVACLHGHFGTHSDRELLVECFRRGIGPLTPSKPSRAPATEDTG